MTDRIDEALHDCLCRLESGDDREAVLAAWPDEAPALAPLLAVAEAYESLALPPFVAGDRAAVRRALVQSWRGASRPRWAGGSACSPTAAAVGLLWLGAVGALRAADSALPGDRLYPLKRTVESLELGLSRAPARLALALAERRLAEAAALVAVGRSPAAALAELDGLAPRLAALPAEATAIARQRDRFGGPFRTGRRARSRSDRDAGPPAGFRPAAGNGHPRVGDGDGYRSVARHRPVEVARMPSPAEPAAAAASATAVLATATSPPGAAVSHPCAARRAGWTAQPPPCRSATVATAGRAGCTSRLPAARPYGLRLRHARRCWAARRRRSGPPGCRPRPPATGGRRDDAESTTSLADWPEAAATGALFEPEGVDVDSGGFGG